MNTGTRTMTRRALAALAWCMTAQVVRGVTGCPGDGSNGFVVTEYLLPEGTGTVTINTGFDGAAGDAVLTNGAAFSTNVAPPNGGCDWSLQIPATGSGSTTPAAETAAAYDPLAGATSFTILACRPRTR